MIFDKLRLVCEEAALGHGLNVPMIKVIAHEDMQISSDGETLYLSSELGEMPRVPLLALISFALYFHTRMALSLRMCVASPTVQKLANSGTRPASAWEYRSVDRRSDH